MLASIRGVLGRTIFARVLAKCFCFKRVFTRPRRVVLELLAADAALSSGAFLAALVSPAVACCLGGLAVNAEGVICTTIPQLIDPFARSSRLAPQLDRHEGIRTVFLVLIYNIKKEIIPPVEETFGRLEGCCFVYVGAEKFHSCHYIGIDLL